MSDEGPAVLVAAFRTELGETQVPSGPRPVAAPSTENAVVAAQAVDVVIGPGMLPGWEDGRPVVARTGFIRGARAPSVVARPLATVSDAWMVVTVAKVKDKACGLVAGALKKPKLRWVAVVKEHLFVLRDLADYYAKQSLKRAAKIILPLRECELLEDAPGSIDKEYADCMEGAAVAEDEAARKAEMERMNAAMASTTPHASARHRPRRSRRRARGGDRPDTLPVSRHTHTFELRRGNKVFVFGLPTDALRRTWVKALHVIITKP